MVFFDQGEQPQSVRIPDRPRPHNATRYEVGVGCGGKCVVKMGNSGDVAGVARQGARKETACVVYEIDGDHVDNLLGKFGDRGRAYGRGVAGSTPRRGISISLPESGTKPV